MRTARPVGLTDDGRSLIVETNDGESISIPADDLRGAWANRTRPQLETEMEQSMTPREIQMKIRAGASVEELVEASGMPIGRVEAFAAPVIAEREHIAGLAQQGSVRRLGEPTGHRTLRAAVGERLKERGVDPESARWDAYKMDDGRWSVSVRLSRDSAGGADSADGRDSADGADRVAVFYFDQRGRFSVAGNEEARWAIGERTSAAGGGPEPVDDADTEPTLKLAGPADELAFLRAVETDGTQESSGQPAAGPAGSDPVGSADQVADSTSASQAATRADDADTERLESEADVEVDDRSAADPLPDQGSPAPIPEEPSQLDLLYDLLGSDGYAEDSIRVFEGLSDATAVPGADDGWPESDPEQVGSDPEQVGSDGVPVEAGSTATRAASVEQQKPSDETPESTDEPDQPTVPDTRPPEVQPEIFADGATQDTLPEVVHEDPVPEDRAPADPAPADPAPADRAPEQPAAEPAPETQVEPAPASRSQPDEAAPPETAPATKSLDAETSSTETDGPDPESHPAPAAEEDTAKPVAKKPAPKPRKRKRAAVPSWDEIMFGSPGSKGK